MKRIKSRFLIYLMIVALSVTFVFVTTASSVYAQKQKTIGLAMHFLQDDWALTMKRGVEEVAAKYNYKLFVTDANFDPARQMEQVESLITRRVDALIVVHLNTEEILPVLDKAKRRGIAVVGSGLPADIFYEKGYLSNLWTDNHIMGLLAGRKMADLLALKGKDDAKIAIVDAPITMYAIQLRVRGFKFATVEEYPKMKIIVEEKAGTIEEAMRVTENLFTAHPDLDAIFATYSTALIGAARAKQARNKMDVVLTGVDNDKEVCKLVKLGVIDGAAVNNGYAFGKQAVEIAHDYLENNKRMTTPYYIPGPLLTAENVEAFYQEYFAEPLSAYMGK